MSKTGGNNPRDNIHRILRKTFTNECSIKCSWKGIRNNFRISNLHLIKIIKSICYRCVKHINQLFIINCFILLFLSFFFSGEVTSHYATCTETDFENIVAEWLRFATQRSKRERAKENVDGHNNGQENIEIIDRINNYEEENEN